MRQWLRSHLTYANVMVTILAFIVFTGGTAVALTGANTVQSDDLGPGAQVTAPDVAANAVNGSDVVDNSLAGADLGPSSVGTSEVAADSLAAGDLAPSSVGTSEVVDGSIASSDLAPAAGGARAYGVFTPPNFLSTSKNVVSVTNPATGIFCITLGGGINPLTAVLLATPNFTTSDTDPQPGIQEVSHVEWSGAGASCPGDDLEVRTFVYNGDPTDNNTGTGNLLGDDLVADNEGFAFVVP